MSGSIDKEYLIKTLKGKRKWVGGVRKRKAKGRAESCWEEKFYAWIGLDSLDGD
jgi:hypothetical protein